jgi:hypothetical protein
MLIPLAAPQTHSKDSSGCIKKFIKMGQLKLKWNYNIEYFFDTLSLLKFVWIIHDNWGKEYRTTRAILQNGCAPVNEIFMRNVYTKPRVVRRKCSRPFPLKLVFSNRVLESIFRDAWIDHVNQMPRSMFMFTNFANKTASFIFRGNLGMAHFNFFHFVPNLDISQQLTRSLIND